MSDQPIPIEADSIPIKNVEDPGFQVDQVASISAGHLTHDIYSAFLAPLLPRLQEKLSLGYAPVGSLVIFTQIPSLLNPFIGYMADRLSVRYFVIFAPAISATLFSSIGFTSSYLALVMLLFTAGISIAAFHAPAPALIARVSGKNVGTGMSIFMASGEMARAIGPMLVTAGIIWFGLEGIWRLAIFGWVMTIFLFFRLRKITPVKKAAGEASLREFWPVARRVFLPLSWLLLGRIFMMVSLTIYLPLYMNDERQGTLWLVAASLTVLELAGVVGALTAGTLSDLFGRKRVLFILLTLSPIIFLLFINSPDLLAFPLLFLLGLLSISPQPVLLATVQDQFSDNKALANGTFLAMNFLIRAFGIWVVGLFADAQGLDLAFTFAAVLAFSSIPAIFFLPREKAAIKASA